MSSPEALSYTTTSYASPSHAAGIERRQRSMNRSLFQVTMRMERSRRGQTLAPRSPRSTRSSNITFAIATVAIQ